MATTWTEEQKQVIDLRDFNMLVSAAAGSGKTAVLVERILSRVTDRHNPVDIDRLLIVTFTNAAAGEMRERIRAALELRMETEEEPVMQAYLQRQISLLQNAQIATIHSFCQYVIRNHFHTIDLDPGLRIADEGEQRLLERDVLERLLEEKYAEGDAGFLQMTEAFAPGRDDSALVEMILELYHFSQSFPWPREWLENCTKPYQIRTEEELDQAVWVQDLMELLTGILIDLREKLKECLKISRNESGPFYYEPALLQDLVLVDDLLNASSYSERNDVWMRREAWKRLSTKKSERVQEEKKQRVKNLRDECKKKLELLGAEFFYAKPQKIIRQMNQAEPMLKAAADLAIAFGERFAEEKIKKNLMDFNDLEHFALQILVQKEEGEIQPTVVAEDFAQRFEEIMIDEYQDSNLVQELILSSVSRMKQGSCNMFMVGDVKQSIYRFRLARPELFMEKYDRYGKGEAHCCRIDLHKNFRSRSQVLGDVNFLFEQLMERHLGNIDYDDASALYPGAVFPEGDDPEFRSTEILFLETDRHSDEEEEKTVALSAREMEAYAVARRIREIVGKERIWDKETESYRPVQYGDIVILLRTVSGWANVFAEVLKQMDIPAHTGARTGYFSTMEVQTVLSLLQIIDNPCQDIPLTAVLHSPIGKLDGRKLAEIRSRYPRKPFYEACMQEETLQGFFDMLQQFREAAVYTPIHELLWQILDETGYGAYVSAMPGGAQRKANLDMLVEKAIAYETGSYRGLYNFVRYIENLHKYDVDFGEAELTGSQEQAVRILSIHKSKGLEFPVVFVSGMGKVMNQSDAKGTLILHPNLGIGCDSIDLKMRTRRPTLLKQCLKRRTVLETMGEELRVLYVALTRAKEKLILTGTICNLKERVQSFSGVCDREEIPLSFLDRSQARTYWDWILPALLRSACAKELLDECWVLPEEENPLYHRNCGFKICRILPEELIGMEKSRQIAYQIKKEELLELPVKAESSVSAADELEQILNFHYERENEADIPSKVSVSELKKLTQYESSEDGQILYEETAPVPLIPEFLQKEREITGAARGTIYHKLMECLDFKRFWGADDYCALLESEISRLLMSGHLNKEEAALIERQKVLLFLQNPLAVRMQKAHAEGKLFRERQFVLEVAASDVKREWSSEKQVLIQGIIDAFFVEEGEIVLLDYKTDFVKFKEASSLYRKYGVQLDYYKQALERLTDLPVKEQLIYSFCLDSVITGDEHD